MNGELNLLPGAGSAVATDAATGRLPGLTVQEAPESDGGDGVARDHAHRSSSLLTPAGAEGLTGDQVPDEPAVTQDNDAEVDSNNDDGNAEAEREVEVEKPTTTDAAKSKSVDISEKITRADEQNEASDDEPASRSRGEPEPASSRQRSGRQRRPSSLKQLPLTTIREALESDKSAVENPDIVPENPDPSSENPDNNEANKSKRISGQGSFYS